ncbi:MAG: efflux RND transporter periplasmic adaptor subunit [Rhodanobacter sp.]|uniref:efflux RND transporter periplasmic adaptor subunit n=1 Tax=Rhodanobacter sp. FW021-MT20 TaxID=1162282 RepID=UPI0012264BB1|nr:MAG: efflux RND transporter periplasmic adaptor subunit [Rhodanobacter sp.]
MSRFWKVALIVIIVIVLLAVGFRLVHKPGGAGQGQGKAGADTPPVPVTVVPVVKQNVPIYLTGLGTVVARNTVTVSPQVSGQLLSINFKEGDPVTKGELLAQIDPRSFQAAYDQAVAQKAQAQAQLDTARSNYQRSQTLLAKGYIAKQELESLRNTVTQDEALVAADKANAESAKVQLGYTRIVSPIDGIAGIRAVDPGNVVSTGTALVTLTQVHPIYVEFNLPEQNLDEVRKAFKGGADLEVSALDRTDSHPIDAGGALQVVDNQINTSTGTFKLRAVFDNKDGNLWPGQFVNVQLKVSTVDGGLVIPSQAVQRGPDGDYVYVVQADKTVKMQPVTVAGEVGDSHVMIDKGVALNQQVVTEGQFRLKPGSKVDALKPGEVPPAPTDAQLKKAQAKGGGRHRGH